MIINGLFISTFLYYLLLCCFLGSDVIEVCALAVPVCQGDTYWNPKTEDCDDCSTYCVPNVPQFMKVCKEKCPNVYARLMHTTSTTQTPISTTTRKTIVTSQNETSSTSFVSSTNEIIQISVIGVCSLLAVLVLTVAVILIRRRKSQSTPTNPGETTSSLVGGSQETFSTPVEAQDGDNGSGSQELSSLSTSQSLGSAEEIEPLYVNLPEDQGTPSLPQLASGVND